MKSTSACKHMGIKYFALHERIKKSKVFVEHIDMELMIADPLTKGLTLRIFKNYVNHKSVISSFYD